MKHVIITGSIFALLFLTACGVSLSGGKQTAVPDAPEETAVPIMADPSAPPVDSAPTDAETAASETAANESTDSISDQNPQSASGRFTGVQGTEFIVPEGFVQLDESPNIGYQYTFWHPDYEIRIAVYEIAPGYIPEGAYETDYNIASNNPDVTYFSKGEGWFVQSGYQHNGEEFFYSKESSTDRGLKTIWITYPTAKREFGDQIAADFEKNCHF